MIHSYQSGFVRGIIVLTMLLLGALAGCTTTREVFPDQSADQVWTALVAAAKSPDYGDSDAQRRWTVRQNDVWVDDENNRIEIYRKLERDLHMPASPPLHENREWKFQVALEQRDPPTVRFTSRQVGVPAHVWDESERYFAEVWKFLNGNPEGGAAPAPAPAAPSSTTRPRDKPAIDIQSLEPSKP